MLVTRCDTTYWFFTHVYKDIPALYEERFVLSKAHGGTKKTNEITTKSSRPELQRIDWPSPQWSWWNAKQASRQKRRKEALSLATLYFFACCFPRCDQTS